MNEENSKTIENKSTQGFASHPENINRNGRPKKGMTLTDIAKEILEEQMPNGVTRKEALMKKVAQLAYDGNESMIKLLWNYIDGMPRQQLDLKGNLDIKGFFKGLIDETNKQSVEELPTKAD